MDLKQLVAAECNFPEEINFVADNLQLTPNLDMGDFCLPCFSFAKVLRKSPVAIAEDLAKMVNTKGFVDKVEVVNGYLNFFVNKKKLSYNIINEILAQGENFGRSDMGKGQTVCIDYSSVNLAKYMHIGHLSTTLIGECLKKVHNYLGYKTVAINYVGDYGTPFGKMIAAYKLWGDEEDVLARGIDAIQDLYVKFNAEAENDESLNDLAREWFKKIETKDEEATKIYNMFIKLAIEDIEKIYSLLNISFDSWRGESYYNDKMQPIIDELAEKGFLQDSQGAKIVDLEEYKLGVCLIQKSDGTSLYATRDLAAADDRYINYNFDKSLYVTDVSQKQHFAQFFKVLELLGRPYHKGLEHIYYGRFSLPNGMKIASRKGKQAVLKDIFKTAIEKAEKVIADKYGNTEDSKKIAEAVGIGAVIFSTLKQEKIKDVVFDLDEALNFDLETSPYIQYTTARCNSILAKAGVNDLADFIKADFNFEEVDNAESNTLLRLLNDFPDTVKDVVRDYEPCYISRLLLDICKAFNKFYNNHRIIYTDKVCQTRLALTKATQTVLSNGLKLLGITVLEKM